MADLVTHACSVLLPAAWLRPHRALPVVALGAVLPDLASRVPGELLERLHVVGLPVPDALVAAWGALHEPIPLLAVCGLIALAFRDEDRATVLGALWLGCVCHLGLDVLQDHHGHGYHLLFPISAADWELGWIGSESTVPWAPWLAAWTAVAWWARWATGGQRARMASAKPASVNPGPLP